MSAPVRLCRALICVHLLSSTGALSAAVKAAAGTEGFGGEGRGFAALLADKVQTSVSLNVSIVPAGAYVAEFAKHKDKHHRHRREGEVLTSWVQVAMLHDGTVSKAEFELLALSLQDALADSLLICRSAVHVNDMKADNVDFVVADGSTRRPGGLSMMQRLTNLLRSATTMSTSDYVGDISITQVKATYEVRIFEAMRLSGEEVARRIDRLQVYSKFAEVSRLLGRFVSQRSMALEGVMLDDLGYAARRQKAVPLMTQRQLESCVEEGLLADARHVHQMVVFFGGVIMLLITCAGSSVFALKLPSWVPSRMYPLAGSPRL